MAAPVANFTFAPQFGLSILPVTFTDTSENSPTSWEWTVTGPNGLALTSNAQNPQFNLNVGRYGVKLVVSNADGSDTKEIPPYNPGGEAGPHVTSGR